MSKVIARLLWFCITTLCDWLTELAPISQPMRCKKPKPIVSCSWFSRAWRQFYVFALNSDWFIALFAPVLIGPSNYFGFGFTTLDWNHSNRAGAVFNWVLKVISRLLWFCFTTLCDWLTKLALLSQPMGIQTKTNRVLVARVFSRLAPVTPIGFEFWLVRCVVYSCCDWHE